MSSCAFRPLAFSVLLVLAGVLTGCDRSSDAPSADEPSPTRSGAETTGPAPSSSASTSPAGPAAAPSAPQAAPVLQSPKVEVPKEVYSPTYEDIQRALAGVLVNTVAGMPASAQRDKWYQQEATRLQTIKVSQCSASSPGTPSVCNIEMSGKAMQIKVLLTTSGWVVVK